ncbi:MAG: LTA synthase family protein [Saprospiraceae bacterium]|nr:LTA synthase family protein [Saprospiraceae bacterium]
MLNKFRTETYFLRQAIVRVATTMLFFSLSRLLFFVVNKNILPSPSVSDFFYGFLFDLSAAMYVNVLLWLTYLLPLPLSIRASKTYVLGQKILFILFNFIAIGFEIGDTGYFRFANRRLVLSDFDLIRNTLDMFPKLFAEHWYLVVLGLSSVFFFNFLFKKTSLRPFPQKIHWFFQFAILILGLGIFLIAARGGLQHRPLTPISSAEYASDLRLMPLVSNTTLNLVHSSGQRFLTEKSYMPEAEAARIYPIFQRPNPKQPFNCTNVVIIAIESCGKEYSAFFNKKEADYQGFTPVLDSLAQHGLYSENSFANGLRSTQGIAAISTGLPSLMDDPFMFSPYQSNQLDGLGAHLRRKGYQTAFFHGAHRGSMDFNKFAPLIGFNEFYARESFPEKEGDYDGTWGIWDEQMFQFMLKKLNETPQPFYGMIFTLTSHHPHKVPDWFEKKYPDINPVHRATLYTDWALGQFMAEAQKQPWFRNTLFVISADHTGVHSEIEKYQTAVGRFEIPILFYKPNEITPSVKTQTCQQIDILPSILDFLNYDEPYLSFGRSIFTPPQYNYVFNWEGGVFQIQDNRHVLLFDGKHTVGFYDYKKDVFLKNNLVRHSLTEAVRLENVIKAVVQQHDKAMLHNGLVPRF